VFQDSTAANAVGMLGLGRLGWADTFLGVSCIVGVSMVVVVVGAKMGRGTWNSSMGLEASAFEDSWSIPLGWGDSGSLVRDWKVSVRVGPGLAES
jgi:hypothetical protein